MKSQWFGDLYDIVKRYFIGILKELGYQVVVDPILTDEWNGLEQKFYYFLGATSISSANSSKSALLLDPDTGIGKKETNQHVTIKTIASHLQKYEVVFTFDQSFSRADSKSGKMEEKMIQKLVLLKETGNFGFYYNSHAKFLFAASSLERLNTVEQKLLSSGLPESRLLRINKRIPGTA